MANVVLIFEKLGLEEEVNLAIANSSVWFQKYSRLLKSTCNWPRQGLLRLENWRANITTGDKRLDLCLAKQRVERDIIVYKYINGMKNRRKKLLFKLKDNK